MKKKQCLSLLLALTLCLSMTLPCAAMENHDSEQSAVTASAPSPRYTHISQIAASLSFSSLGRANCGASYTIRNDYDDYTSTVTGTLQQYNYDTMKWDDVKEWTETYSGSGVHGLDKGYYVSEGRYRFNVTLQIYDVDDILRETVSCISPIKER